jgi:hypothetical protein
MGTQGRLRKNWERFVSLMQSVRMIFMSGARRAELRATIRNKAFVRIAQEGRWGAEYSSGAGSTVEYTEGARRALRRVIELFDIKSMVDVACGDFAWMPLVLEDLPEGFRYVGGDIVPGLVERAAAAHPEHEFQVLDFVSGELPDCELIFCRDVLQHLPIADILEGLRNFSGSGAKYLLATTHPRHSSWGNGRDKRAGQCNDRNLMLGPFNLGDPIAIFGEQDPCHKFLGLWELPLRDVSGDVIASPPAPGSSTA